MIFSTDVMDKTWIERYLDAYKREAYGELIKLIEEFEETVKKEKKKSVA